MQTTDAATHVVPRHIAAALSHEAFELVRDHQSCPCAGIGQLDIFRSAVSVLIEPKRRFL